VQDFSLEEMARIYLYPIGTLDTEARRTETQELEEHEIGKQWLKAYQSLEPDEFQAFNDVLYSLAMEDEDIANNMDRSTFSLAQEFRDDINTVAQKRHGTSYNKIATKEVRRITEDLWSEAYKARSQTLSSALSCICPVYPLLAIPAGMGWWNNSLGRQRAANPPICSDCDLEVWFPFGNDRIQWVSGAGGTYYTWLGARFALRKVMPFNRLLIGYGAVNAVFLGSEYLALIAYRMIP
jgi:hypothetical protein